MYTMSCTCVVGDSSSVVVCGCTLLLLRNYLTNCLVCLVVLSATAALEVLGLIPRSSKKMLLGFSMKFDLCPVNGNKLAPNCMGPKHTGGLWVYIGTPLSAQPFGEYRRDGMSKSNHLF